MQINSTCIVAGCSQNKRLYSLPSTESLLLDWLININRLDLLEKCKSATKYKICAAHFEDSCFQNADKKKLNRKSVPTLLLPAITANNEETSAVKSVVEELSSTSAISEDPSSRNLPPIHFKYGKRNHVDTSENLVFSKSTKVTPTSDLPVQYSLKRKQLFDDTPTLCVDGISERPQLRNNPTLIYNYCRLCANMLPINSLLFLNDNKFYIELIKICLQEKFQINDKLPLYICTSCATNLKICCKILTKFNEGDTKLKHIFKINNTPKIIQKDNTLNVCEEKRDMGNQTKIMINSHKIHQPENQTIPEAVTDQPKNKTVPETVTNQPKIETVPETVTNQPKNKTIPETVTNQPKNKTIPETVTNQPKNKTIPETVTDQLKNKTIPETVTNQPKNKTIPETVTNQPKNQTIAETIAVKIIESGAIPLKTKRKKLQCIVCNLIIDSKSEVITHMKNVHPHLPKNVILAKLINVQIKQVFNQNAHSQKNILNNVILQKQIDLVPPTNFPKTSDKYLKYLEEFTEKEQVVGYKVKYECKVCLIIYDSYKAFSQHYNQTHSPIDQKSNKVLCTVVKVGENSIIPVNDDSIILINTANDSDAIKVTETRQGIIKNFKCLTCYKLCPSKIILKHHMKRRHSKNFINLFDYKLVPVKYIDRSLRFECLICVTQHSTQHTFKRHINEFHPTVKEEGFLCRLYKNKNLIDCLHCDSKLYFEKYSIHIQQHHTTYTCNKCEETFNNVKDCRRHRKNHELSKIPAIFQCSVCDKTFGTKTLLSNHENEHKEEKIARCDKCKKMFHTEYHLLKHKKKHELKLCNFCGKLFKSSYINTHVKLHNSDQFKCVKCKLTFKTMGELRKHRKSHNPHKKNTLCQFCGKIYQDSKKFYLHIQLHSNIKPYSCDLCGEKFRRRDILRSHRRKHFRLKEDLICKECNIPFLNKKNYFCHLKQIHAVEKSSFACSFCSRKFINEQKYIKHLKLHEENKFSKCDECGKIFQRYDFLCKHKLKHMK